MKVQPSTSRLDRVVLLHALTLLAASIVSIATRSAAPFVWIGLVAFAAWLALAHVLRLAPAPFGAANLVTSMRVASTGYLALAQTNDGLFTAALVLLVFALDGLDGLIARRTNTTSEFGAAYDMETDAFLVMTLSLLLWTRGIAGPWVLLAGLLRYVYALAVRLLPTRGEVPRSRLGRYVFAILLMSFAAAFILPGPWNAALAAAATVLIAYSFLRSAYWSFLTNSASSST